VNLCCSLGRIDNETTPFDTPAVGLLGEIQNPIVGIDVFQSQSGNNSGSEIRTISNEKPNKEKFSEMQCILQNTPQSTP